jgi:D-glycero-alpha-D-manno-heptose-7-phosphate kinase
MRSGAGGDKCTIDAVPAPQPLVIINSLAPIRICDTGGWTDTWFAQHGSVFNIAVSPFAEVQVAVFPTSESGPGITLHAENHDDRYRIDRSKRWGKHPLLEAAVEYMRVAVNLCLEISLYSQAPSGASTGTSAAVTVALVGALDALRSGHLRSGPLQPGPLQSGQLTPGRLTPHEVATAAHRIETELLGQQSGIQDQLASAYGGINYIEMSEYPRASVWPIRVPEATEWELERRLALIYLGKSHRSSELHERVIAGLESAGPDHPPLEDLRRAAARSRDALAAGDFAALGAAMIDNVEAQARLHPDLIGREAARVIEIARAHGALGWKVNGAGGAGGSLTLLCGDRSTAKRALLREIEQEDPGFKNIPIRLSHSGLRVWTYTNRDIDGP